MAFGVSSDDSALPDNGASPADRVLFSVAPRGPPTAYHVNSRKPRFAARLGDGYFLPSRCGRGPLVGSVSKNPWPDTHSATKWRDTEPPYNVQPPEPFKMPRIRAVAPPQTEIPGSQSINFNDAGPSVAVSHASAVTTSCRQSHPPPGMPPAPLPRRYPRGA
jgi:hypothetical protein